VRRDRIDASIAVPWVVKLLKRHKDIASTRDRSPPAPARGVEHLLVPLVLVALAGLAYINAGHEGFFFDSTQSEVLARPALHGYETWVEFWRQPLKPGQQFTYLTFALNYQANLAMGRKGLDVAGFLMFNVVLHALNACLVYLLIRSLMRQLSPDRPVGVWIPAALAALFAVHPIHVASVVYIIQRRSTMATTFYVLAVLGYLRLRRSLGWADACDRHPERSDRPRLPILAWAAGTLLSYWLAYRCKEMALTLPFVLALIEFCLRGCRQWTAKRYWTYVAAGMFLYAALMLTGLAVIGRFKPTAMQLSGFGAPVSWGVWPHFLSMCRVFVQFWKILLLPLRRWSCIDHDFDLSFGLWEHGAIWALGLHLALVVAAFAMVRRGRVLAGIGVLWFYAVQIPYMVLPQPELFVEYKTYLPSIGVLLILADVSRWLEGRIRQRWCLAMWAVVCAVLLGTTLRRNVVYQNEFNLWSDVVAKNPHHYRPHNNLANVLVNMAERAETPQLAQEYRRAAEQHLLESLKYFPANSACYNNLGRLRVDENRLDEAADCFRKAIEYLPESCVAYYNLANVYWMQKDLPRAEEYYRKALAINPDHANSCMNLARVLAAQGKGQEAESFAAKARQLQR
jgi:tetratricopeptide (TPR) repeat protein